MGGWKKKKKFRAQNDKENSPPNISKMLKDTEEFSVSTPPGLDISTTTTKKPLVVVPETPPSSPPSPPTVMKKPIQGTPLYASKNGYNKMSHDCTVPPPGFETYYNYFSVPDFDELRVCVQEDHELRQFLIKYLNQRRFNKFNEYKHIMSGQF